MIILRTDAIGDYLLFRPFLAELKANNPAQHIVFVGNIVYKDLALAFDSDTIDTFIWIHHSHFYRPLIMIRLLKTLLATTYDVLLNPVHSRDGFNIFLSQLIRAKAKYAPLGDCCNLSPHTKHKSDRIFTALLPSLSQTSFEFLRNRAFFSAFLGKELHTKLYMNPALLTYPQALDSIQSIKPKTYSVLFIGASADYRKWSIAHFADVGVYLCNTHNQHIIICGGSEDSINGEKLKQMIESSLSYRARTHIINLCGQTTLLELGGVVYNGNLLVSNETSAAHLGSILDTTIVIVVSNGNHLGRFIPYPKGLRDKYYPVFHPFIEENFDKYEALSNQYAYKSHLNIDDITPEMVIARIKRTPFCIYKSHTKELQNEQNR